MLLIQFAVFLTIFTSIYLGMHWYVYSRIAGALHLSHPAAFWLRIGFLSFAFSFVAGQILTKKFISPLTTAVSWVSSVWMGVIAIAITAFIINDLLRLVFRSEGFRYYSCIVSLCLITVVSLYSAASTLGLPRLKEIDIPSPKIPADKDGFKIVQISDIHIDFAENGRWFEKVVEQSNALDPDLVVITGDLLDADLTATDLYAGILRKLKSKHGVYAVTGNHEFYVGLPVFTKLCEMSGIKVLRNESASVNGFLDIAGIDDQQEVRRGHAVERLSGRNGNSRKEFFDSEIEKMLEKHDRSKFTILLSHQPDVFAEASRMVDLQLSGHTHNGQLPPMDIIVQFYFKYPYGLYKQGESYLYTTSGTGTWGPPMRTTSKNELVLIRLQTAD